MLLPLWHLLGMLIRLHLECQTMNENYLKYGTCITVCCERDEFSSAVFKLHVFLL